MHIIGHQKIRERLKKRAGQSAGSQAFLFHGPSGIGKSLAALEFAARLASQPDFLPTPDLPSPTDVLVVRPEQETKKGVTKQKRIGVETLREALTFLSRFPASGRYRVLIIEAAEMLSLAAANALLKNLEEPNATSVIILVSSHKGRLLPTLLSRVEKFRFAFLPEEEMKEAFTDGCRKEEDPAFVQFLFSLGRPGLLVRAQADPEFFSATREKLGKLFRLSRLSLPARLQLAEELSLNVPATAETLEWWLPGLHTLAFRHAATGKARFFSYLEEVEETLFLLRTTQANARLLLEKLFLSLP